MAALAANPKAFAALAAQPNLAALMANPSFSAALNQAGVAQAAAQGNPSNGTSAWGHDNAMLLGGGHIAYVELAPRG
jgi:hypothetical protein